MYDEDVTMVLKCTMPDNTQIASLNRSKRYSQRMVVLTRVIAREGKAFDEMGTSSCLTFHEVGMYRPCVPLWVSKDEVVDVDDEVVGDVLGGCRC